MIIILVTIITILTNLRISNIYTWIHTKTAIYFRIQKLAILITGLTVIQLILINLLKSMTNAEKPITDM
jgi:hypothetical protein